MTKYASWHAWAYVGEEGAERRGQWRRTPAGRRDKRRLPSSVLVGTVGVTEHRLKSPAGGFAKIQGISPEPSPVPNRWKSPVDPREQQATCPTRPYSPEGVQRPAEEFCLSGARPAAPPLEDALQRHDLRAFHARIDGACGTRSRN